MLKTASYFSIFVFQEYICGLRGGSWQSYHGQIKPGVTAKKEEQFKNYKLRGL
jgi:hypothetical protein